jgi:hypothetical protein
MKSISDEEPRRSIAQKSSMNMYATPTHMSIFNGEQYEI